MSDAAPDWPGPGHPDYERESLLRRLDPVRVTPIGLVRPAGIAAAMLLRHEGKVATWWEDRTFMVRPIGDPRFPGWPGGRAA